MVPARAVGAEVRTALICWPLTTSTAPSSFTGLLNATNTGDELA
ncbi:MAG: hypothetical protein QOI76_87 [Frankiales bacterium]|jgi:hypothetical protein|nr:hypothetical protein [Frankiales bacterium]